MSGHLTIALDAMGGDLGPEAVIPGAALALSRNSDLRFMIFGDELKITPILEKFPKLSSASQIIHTDQFVSSEEKPGVALRNGRKSSMRLAINAVADKQADCIVSGGNTGALMVMAKMVLKCLPGIDRPAIASLLPTMGKETVMLDLGANLECDAAMLVQFAILGSVYSRVVRGHDQPTVGLLNIGSEDMKGHDEIKEAAAILQQIKFPGKYIGFVEGNDIPMGKVDVVVTDGFTGNVALKTAEGVSKLIAHMLKKSLKASPLAFLGAILAQKALKSLKNEMDPREYNGGMFLGVDGVCVKSHGGMDHVGFANAIQYASELAARNFNVRVAAEIAEVMIQEKELNILNAEQEPLKEKVS
ncbi:MAG TPA: phosphate acyltransferase PlsX [Alphaproteobacteria bacterium]|jgi:glycerol-3-phosphate acyltransferase PlsX|nr:phosphate acyltransferase PlsX [Alphaproteobacteria bacterium]MCB9984613.1 phosphate acyltransferase PlsX [Micavibrio sp.]HRK97956.1 phosphate acyltransferase PlsX [Alphaproteobacteria bacterium]